MQLIRLLLHNHSLRLGQFTLKSGRSSPFFFDSGPICQGETLGLVATAMAERLLKHTQDDQALVLYAAPYKGIPLAAATAVALAQHNPKVSFCYSRKESKIHGEGGILVGADMKQKPVWIVDDVLTAGTAVRAAAQLIQRQGGQLAGIVLLFDRLEGSQEQSEIPTSSQLQRDWSIPVVSLFNIHDLIQTLEEQGRCEEALSLRRYRQTCTPTGAQTAITVEGHPCPPSP